ncbi:ribonuclease HII [Candidatus Saccharibacteria bacterium]|nr:ribonuclease HII [Candidatus Saccharibacteria bacterium]
MAILGIDEVGRGPWAGPLIIGAVILPKDTAGNYPAWVEPLIDSKKLSAKKREAYANTILENASATGLGWVSSQEIDQFGLAESLRLATRRAVEIIKQQKAPFTEIIIDGTQNFLRGTSLENYVTTLKKGDLLIKEISAASIIAKVARDRYMTELAQKYPEYDFDKHVGYGTATHKSALEKYGPCPEHRLSFGPVKEQFNSSSETLRSLRASDRARHPQRRAGSTRVDEESINCSCPTTKQLGDRAENLVADYLKAHGHRIVARNHKTKFYEIDIVSTKGDKIYFTEVKYRKNSYRGTPLDIITKKKLQQMTFAARAFLKYHQDLASNYSPLLAAGLVSGSNFHFDDWFTLN